MSQLGALKSPLFKILSPLFQYSAQATQVPASLVNMLGFTKTLSLLALMAAGGTQIANACDCSGCSSTTFSGSTTIESSCSSSQTSYVEDVKIANDDDYSSSFSYSAGSCSSSQTACDSGSSCGETSSVSITCERTPTTSIVPSNTTSAGNASTRNRHRHRLQTRHRHRRAPTSPGLLQEPALSAWQRRRSLPCSRSKLDHLDCAEDHLPCV